MALEGLKGLTAQDRANWEKKYSAYLSGKSSDEIERMYRNENTSSPVTYAGEKNITFSTKVNLLVTSTT